MEFGKGIQNAWLMLDPSTPILATRAVGSAGEEPGPLSELFRSPVLSLIEHVYRSYPKSARHHLRKPIFVDGEPGFAEHALVKMTAKRMRVTADPPPRAAQPVSACDPIAPKMGLPNLLRTGSDIRGALENLLQREREDEDRPLYLRDRPVGALLIRRSGEVVLAARNESSVARCRHAEVNLLRKMSSRFSSFPEEMLFAVTLKPCRMCAAFLIASARSLGDLRVVYLEDDPGHLASGTALDTASPGRLEFLRERRGLPMAQAQRIIADPAYEIPLQKKASVIEGFDGKSPEQLWSAFRNPG